MRAARSGFGKKLSQIDHDLMGKNGNEEGRFYHRRAGMDTDFIQKQQ